MFINPNFNHIVLTNLDLKKLSGILLSNCIENISLLEKQKHCVSFFFFYRENEK